MKKEGRTTDLLDRHHSTYRGYFHEIREKEVAQPKYADQGQGTRGEIREKIAEIGRRKGILGSEKEELSLSETIIWMGKQKGCIEGSINDLGKA